MSRVTGSRKTAPAEPRTAAAVAEHKSEPLSIKDPVARRGRPGARPAKRSRPAPKIQKVVLEEDRGSMLMMGLLLLIILAAAGVILVSFNVV